MSGLTESQKDVRRTRLTGSTWAAYLGFNPWLHRLDAWRIAMGELGVPETDELRGGTVLEDGIAHLVEMDLGIATYKPDSTFHPAYPEAIVVHFDRLCEAERLSIQVKNHWPWVYRASYKGAPLPGAYHNNLVPLHLNMQCQAEMLVAEAAFGEGWGQQCILAAYFGGHKPRLYWIARHHALQEQMLRAGLDFWRRHLDPHGPQERPTIGRWIGAPQKTAPAPARLSDADLLSAPIPTYT